MECDLFIYIAMTNFSSKSQNEEKKTKKKSLYILVETKKIVPLHSQLRNKIAITIHERLRSSTE